MAGRKFETALFKDEDTSGAGIKIPFDVPEASGKKRPGPGEGHHRQLPIQGLDFPIRRRPLHGREEGDPGGHRKTYGDVVHVIMEVDEEPRVVEVPEDFARALARNERTKTLFDKLPYSHQKEYVEHINGAKKEETRMRRIMKTIDKLEGK